MITDNYIITGASGDNFDCNDTGGWTEGGNAEAVTSQNNSIEGGKSLGLTSSDTGDCYWYHDISSSDRFKITEKDMGIWFYYIKGKGNNFLAQDGTAIVIRLYFGGTDKYADYRLTKTGDLELKFGWQLLMCSGSNMNNGSTGGGHNEGSDWNLDIYRFELHLNVTTAIDVPLGLDAIFIGTEINVQEGDIDNPVTIEDLENYSFNTREGFPIGVVELSKKLANIRCGLEISNNGYVSGENLYLLFNQLSSEVEHNIHVSNGTFRVGKLEIGDDDVYPILGCTIAKPNNAYSNITIDTDGHLEIYNSKFYRWANIFINGNCILDFVDFDSNETLYFNSENVNYKNISVHNNANKQRDNAVEINNNPNTTGNLKIYNCVDGIYFKQDASIHNVEISDVSGYHIGISDNITAEIITGEYQTMRKL